jgi:hypothetical protein
MPDAGFTSRSQLVDASTGGRFLGHFGEKNITQKNARKIVGKTASFWNLTAQQIA